MTECERTAQYFDGELPADEEAAVLLHLAGCASCQAELGDWVGMETALSRSRTGGARPASGRHEPIVEPRPERRRRGWRIAAIAVPAAAAIAVLWFGRARTDGPDPLRISLAETRSIEARFTAPDFDRYRPYRVDRGAAARELVPVGVLDELDRRGDRAGLAAAHALGGDLPRAAAALDQMQSSALRDSDQAAVELARDPIRALELTDVAIARAPDLAQAHWNRALALRKLDLPLAAAAELDAVAARGEPGWADEARRLAATLRTPIETRHRDLRRFNEAKDAMIAGTGGPLDADLVRRYPGAARRALLDALAVAGSAGEARALAPVAAALDRLAGNDRASRAVAAVADRDFAVRARFRSAYRALAAGTLEPAKRVALVADLDGAGGAVADILIGVLLWPPPTADTVSRLQRAIPPDDPWLGLQLARMEGAVKIAAGDLFGAERALLAMAPACRDAAWTLMCGYVDLDLAQLYLQIRRLDEAAPRLRAARAAFQREGKIDAEDFTLRPAVNLERLRDRDRLAAAQVQEIELRVRDPRSVQGCQALRFAAESASTIAFDRGDVAGARAALMRAVDCGQPPTTLWLLDAIRVARAGNASDRERAAQLIGAARGAAGSPAVVAEVGEGRLLIDEDPARGAAQLRSAFAKIAALGADPGTAGELRGWGFAALISDAGRRGDWAGALALFSEELGRAPPAGCVAAVSLDDERAIAMVRGRDGAVRGEYQPARALGDLGADTIVSPALVAALTGCEAIAVIARPPLHGHVELLPAALPWSFVGGSGGTASPPKAPAKRRVIVADPQPPAALGLPSLAPVADDSATVVMGGAATPSRVLGELGDAGYVEIHAHGVVDASDAAFLALSPDADGSFALTAAQVRAARVAGAPIVVLAACRSAATARYQAYRWSLPDAFLAAGARAVIASSTAIPDDQGATLFAELRARIDRGERPAQAVAALRAARVAAGQAWAAGLMVFE